MTIKIKQRFMQFISCVLVAAILLPAIAAFLARAADTSDVRGTTLHPNLPWSQGYADGLPVWAKGFFTNKFKSIYGGKQNLLVQFPVHAEFMPALRICVVG
jgi:hypothetical protein